MRLKVKLHQFSYNSFKEGIYDPASQEVTMAYDKPELKLSSVKGDYKYLSTDRLYRLHSIES